MKRTKFIEAMLLAAVLCAGTPVLAEEADPEVILETAKTVELTDDNTKVEWNTFFFFANFSFDFVRDVKVWYEDRLLEEGKDYTLSIQVTEDEVMSAEIRGIGKYSGRISSRNKSYPMSLQDARLVLADTTYEYTGKPIEPAVYGSYDYNYDLERDEDFYLEYENNIKPGIGIVRVCGIGKFTDTVEFAFEIKDSTEQEQGIDLHRLYNPNSGEHFYTSSPNEKNGLIKQGWRYEGIGWTAPEKSHTPVYRLYNKNAGDHHYTKSLQERDTLIRVGWSDEGIGWYSDDKKSEPLYRQYNPNAQAGSHNYTPSQKEHSFLTANGWNDEGIAWYGLKKK